MIAGGTMRMAVGLLWALTLSGCVSQQQDQKIAAAIQPTSPSESSLSGEQLRSCFAAAPQIQAKLNPDSIAQYNQSATYKLASLMKRSPNDIPQYAGFVRGYVFPYEASSVFGTHRFNAVCYFGDPGNGTRFLAMIVTDSVGSVQRAEMVGAVVEAYETLSGKDLSSIERAVLVMSIPH